MKGGDSKLADAGIIGSKSLLIKIYVKKIRKVKTTTMYLDYDI